MLSKGAVSGLLLVAGAGVAAAGVASTSCIPDLPADASDSGAAPVGAGPDAPPPLCGNGYIDLAAGEQCDPGPRGGEAGASLCTSDCKVVCPGGFVWKANNHCYWLGRDAASFAEATELVCNPLNANAHVVTFASDDEFKAVTGALATGAAPGALWVGYQQGPLRYTSIVPYEPGWAPDCPGCFVKASAGGLLPRYQDAGSAGCVKAPVDPDAASWEAYPCMGAPRLHVVCEREPLGILSQACEAGVCIDLAWTYAEKSYVFSTNPLSADAAEAACAGLGGTLVVLGSRDEREQLWHELAALGAVAVVPTAIWVGLGLQQQGDAGAASWVWDDGTPADAPDAYPPPWGVAEPRAGGAGTRAYLAAMSDPQTVDSTLAHADPQKPLPFVCQVPATAP